MLFRLFFLLFVLSISLSAQDIPDTVVVYKSLEKIHIPDSNVIALKLKRKGFHQIPDSILKYSKLKYLDLSGNKLKEIPSWLNQLDSLEYLKLTGNKIAKINPDLSVLPLKYLDLGNNQLDSLDESIGQFNSVEYLILWSNNLYYFSDQLDALTLLKKFDLRGMSISYDEQDRIKELLPKAKIYFDVPCDCHD